MLVPPEPVVAEEASAGGDPPGDRGSRRADALLVALAVPVCFAAMAARAGPEVLDDGAFFLRYAENMIAGSFWVWNPGEDPIWGASAPLYTLLLAIPLALGADGHEASVGTGFVLTLLAIVGTAVALRRRFGGLAAGSFAVLARSDLAATLPRDPRLPAPPGPARPQEPGGAFVP